MPADREPNDHVFSALDLGVIDSSLEGRVLEEQGRVSGSDDLRDVLRVGPVDDAVDGRILSLHIEASDARVRVQDLRSPLDGVHAVGADGLLRLVLRAGADYSIAIERAGARDGVLPWRVTARLESAAAVSVAKTQASLLAAAEAAQHRDAVLGARAFEFVEREVLVCCPEAEEQMPALGFRKLAGTDAIGRWVRDDMAYSADRATAQLEHADLLRRVRRALPRAQWISPNLRTSLEDALAGSPRPMGGAMPMGMPMDPDDEFWTKKEQFNLTLTRFPEAWAVTTGSDDVHIAVVDTGMQVSHPDLAPRVSSFGYDFIADAASAGDGDGIDADPSEPDDFDIFFFHGTYCGGVAAAVTNNKIGVAGATWKGKVLPIRVFGRLGGTSYDRVQAYRYLAGERNDSGNILPVTERPKVINMSFAIPIPTAAEHAEVQRLYAQNVKMVAAIDNQGFDPAPPLYPAAWPEVLCCASVDEKLVRASYSNAADYVDICAPGGTEIAGPKGVVSTWAFRQNGKLQYLYNSFFGTSVATPAISAALALMESVHPDLHPELARRILAETCRDLGPAGKDRYYGHGLLVADAAVLRARELDKAPVLTLTPMSLRIEDSLTSAKLAIGNSGGRIIENLSVIPASGPLSFGLPLFAPGDLDIALDRSLSRVGNHTERFTLRSSASDIDFELSWRTPIPQAPQNFEIWLSRDGRFLEKVRSTVDGSFSIEGLAAGSYILEAGVDRDANGRLGDAQEWYLSRRVEVGAAQTGQLSGVIPWKND